MDMAVTPRLFTCEMCGEIFNASNTEAERDDEARQLYSGESPSDDDDTASLCTGCYEQVLPMIRSVIRNRSKTKMN